MTRFLTSVEIAAGVRAGTLKAADIVDAAIARIGSDNPAINAVTRLLAQRARRRAAEIDAAVAGGGAVGPLAGVPFGVKDLFDVDSLPTTAGAALRRDCAPAATDAEAIRRLEAAGAVLVATLNMDEFAYGFATDNACWGLTRNPHDLQRLAGGSSGGSAAAVAAGMLPLTLGSDTNGSVRVPAGLCGVYGLKPTHGTLPMDGVFPFVDSFDDIGPFSRSVGDLELAWRVLGGQGEAMRAAPRIGRLGGWFCDDLGPEMARALDALAAALGAAFVELPGTDQARSAAFLMTAAEGGARHLPTLRHRAIDFDPATRDRLIAGAALPAAAYADARRFQAVFRDWVLRLFDSVDVLIAPSTSGPAPLVDQPYVEVGGRQISARANLGLYTQPISFVGLPVLAAPLRTSGRLPLGVQLIAAPDGEATLFALAHRLEAQGLIGFEPPLTPQEAAP